MEAENRIQMESSHLTTTDENSNAPPDIKFDTVVVDIAFHPVKNVIAAGTIDGEVQLFSYSTEGPCHELMSLNTHKKPCRAVHFSSDGNLLFTASKDKSVKVVDMNTGAVVHHIIKASSSPLYSLLPIDEYLLATGDDDGCFKVWDYRRLAAIMESKECEEFISDMTIDANKRTVLATSGEGTLTAFNIRQHKMELQSELFDSECLSVSLLKNGTKAVVGTCEGALNIFNWGEWGNISDRFPGHSDSIDAIVPVNENIICTGSGDGNIRAVHILPNRIIGIVGSHNEFPIENLSLSHDKKFLSSCSHDQMVKFWNISCLEEVVENPSTKPDRKRKSKVLSSSKKADFFSGFSE